MPILHRMKTILDVLSSVAIVVAAGALVWSIWNRSASAARPLAPEVNVEGVTIEGTKLSNVKGQGRIAIVEFSDYQCPYCATHAQEVLPALDKEFIETGIARYIPFEYPIEGLHPNAFRAGEAAECAGSQGAYWQMHDRLFLDRSKLSSTDLSAYAAALGLDMTRFAQCLGGEMRAKILAHRDEGKRLGVTGTPVFFLGTVQADGSVKLAKRISGVNSIERFRSEIAELAH